MKFSSKQIIHKYLIKLNDFFVYNFYKYIKVHLLIDFLIDGHIFSFCPDPPEAVLSTLIVLHKLTQSL
jgi:hypothetical protein